ncbi:TetR/AcrR family transcriptional regulator [Microbacterium sp. NPDC058345]|uniref:TetR/AcrR family transcriptional regulator n=1 Tax=Microbacterium sp. NPDC058345 TaxID=3346455 RepID=UPI00365D0121
MITDHAIAVLAAGGARALSHQAVDRAAGLATGSTSYYFRSRRDLVAATIRRIREHSRAAFDASPVPEKITPAGAATFMESQLHRLAGHRREHALAVFSLLPEVEDDPELRKQLSSCLFSRDRAATLIDALGGRDPGGTAMDLVDLLTGVLFGLLFGERRDEGVGAAPIAETLRRFLTVAIADVTVG